MNGATRSPAEETNTDWLSLFIFPLPATTFLIRRTETHPSMFRLLRRLGGHYGLVVFTFIWNFFLESWPMLCVFKNRCWVRVIGRLWKNYRIANICIGCWMHCHRKILSDMQQMVYPLKRMQSLPHFPPCPTPSPAFAKFTNSPKCFEYSACSNNIDFLIDFNAVLYQI